SRLMKSMLIKSAGLAAALMLAGCGSEPSTKPPALATDAGYSPGGTPQAIAGNRNLVVAQDNLAAAHEAVLVAAGGLYPHVDFSASVERQRNNFQAFGIQLFPPKEFNTFQFGPTVSYSFNPAGPTAHEVERQQALEDFQGHELKAAYLTLSGSAVTEAIT